MNPAVSNLVVSLLLMQVARKIDFDNKDTLFYVRVGYVASQLVCIAMYYYASIIIKRKNDTKVLKYVEPKSPMQQEPGAMITTTNRDYDLAEITKAVRSILIGVLMMGGMHLYLGYTQPLFMQGILPLKGLYDSNILKIHIVGRPATGPLKRPFEQPAGLFNPAPAKAEGSAAAVEAKKDK